MSQAVILTLELRPQACSNLKRLLRVIAVHFIHEAFFCLPGDICVRHLLLHELRGESEGARWKRGFYEVPHNPMNSVTRADSSPEALTL